jgi:hypothetical protein
LRLFTSTVMVTSPVLNETWPKPVMDLIMNIFLNECESYDSQKSNPSVT